MDAVHVRPNNHMYGCVVGGLALVGGLIFFFLEWMK